MKDPFIEKALDDMDRGLLLGEVLRKNGRVDYKGMGRIKSWIQGPRWSGLRGALQRCAYDLDLTIASLSEDKGWLHTTIYFEITGKAHALRELSAWLDDISDDDDD